MQSKGFHIIGPWYGPLPSLGSELRAPLLRVAYNGVVKGLYKDSEFGQMSTNIILRRSSGI